MSVQYGPWQCIIQMGGSWLNDIQEGWAVKNNDDVYSRSTGLRLQNLIDSLA